MDRVSPLVAVCTCCKKHNPNPLTLDRHHIQPESWDGPSIQSNLIVLCPTCHHSVHALIDLYVILNRQPTWAEMRHKWGVLPSKMMRTLAAVAWANRPPHPTYTSMAWR